ncbi:hypothetical protein SDJN03_10249, partial [Cucurbita argyrosperma subsp. sororia]
MRLTRRFYGAAVETKGHNIIVDYSSNSQPNVSDPALTMNKEEEEEEEERQSKEQRRKNINPFPKIFHFHFRFFIVLENRERRVKEGCRFPGNVYSLPTFFQTSSLIASSSFQRISLAQYRLILRYFCLF